MPLQGTRVYVTKSVVKVKPALVSLQIPYVKYGPPLLHGQSLHEADPQHLWNLPKEIYLSNQVAVLRKALFKNASPSFLWYSMVPEK